VEGCHSLMGLHAAVATPAPKYGSCVLLGIPADVMHGKDEGRTRQGQDFVPANGAATAIAA